MQYLRDDATNYSNIKTAQNDREFRAIRNGSITSISTKFNLSIQQYKPDEKLQSLADEVNVLRGHVGLGLDQSEKIALNKNAVSAATSSDVEKLSQFRDDIKEESDKAIRKRAELSSYRVMLVSYISLVNGVDQSLFALEKAVDQNNIEIPSNDLMSLYIKLRVALQTYQDSKGK